MLNRKKLLKKAIFVDKSVTLGKNVIIHNNVTISGNSVIMDNVEIFSGTEITDSVIGEGTKIKSSYIENSHIGKNNSIGPFSHIRPGTKTQNMVHIGSFVEVKNSSLGEGTKASHLAYIGDADIGKNVNIGCGAIFINFNGIEKKRSRVGDGAFIGSNSNIIAPVTIGKRAYICAGTSVTKDVEDDAMVIGRVRQEVKPEMAKKYLSHNKSD